MPVLEHDDAIKQYYELVKDKYPDIDFTRFRVICRSPFQYVKKCIQSAKMPFIRIKYLGLFRLFKPKIVGSLTALRIAYKKGRVDPEYFESQERFLLSHLKRLEDEKIPRSDQEIKIIED